jgi:tripartite-type tricarboxylate transporter receptor subunit TctC
MPRITSPARWAALAFLSVAATGTVRAQTPEQFFARKTINIAIGYSAGGSYDLYGRLISRHFGKHIPGQPTVVAQNMPGGGSLKAANYLYEVAPHDGTVLGVIVDTAALEQVLDNPGVHYNADKFSYIGRVATSNNVFLMWHTSKVQSIAEAQKIESTLAGTGPANVAETVPKLLNALIGTKFKIISGYPASTEGMLAMERGEVDGAGTSWTAVKVGRADWLRDKKIKIILQTAPERSADLPDAPSIAEYGKNDADKQLTSLYASGSAVGRSLLGPPGIPADRLKALRDAFMAMVKDPDFLAEVKKMNIDLEPLSGDAMQTLVEKTLSIPKEVSERGKALFGR